MKINPEVLDAIKNNKPVVALESTIIWDEYLAYAVAFGIPNKIIEKFNEGLMNTNIIIQKIESILNF